MRGERVLVRPPFHDHDAVIFDRVGRERVVEATRLLRAGALDVGADGSQQGRATLRLDLDRADDQNLHGHPLLTGGRREPRRLCYTDVVAV
jgi:hypothetical protein